MFFVIALRNNILNIFFYLQINLLFHLIQIVFLLRNAKLCLHISLLMWTIYFLFLF